MYVSTRDIPARFLPRTMAGLGATQADWERLCARSRLPRNDPNYRRAPNACANAARLANPNPTVPVPAVGPNGQAVIDAQNRLAAAEAARVAAEAAQAADAERAALIQRNNANYRRVNRELRAQQAAQQAAIDQANAAAAAAEAARVAAAAEVDRVRANNMRFREVNQRLRAENATAQQTSQAVVTAYNQEAQVVPQGSAQPSSAITQVQPLRLVPQDTQPVAPTPATPSGGSSNMLLIGALAVGAVLMLSGRKGKR